MNIAVRLGYLVAVGTGVVLMLILHRPPDWFPLDAGEYARVVWTIDLALGAVIVAYTLLIFYDPPWLKHFIGAILSILSLLAAYTVYRVFPFRFGASFWDMLTRAVLLLAAAASVVGIIMDLGRLLTSREGEAETK
jgi:hypothetical protein